MTTLDRSRANSLAIAAALLSAGAMGCMAFATKMIARSGLPAIEIAFFRFFFGLVPLLAVRLTKADFRASRWHLVFCRCLSGSVAVVLYFLSIEHGTVGGATLLNATAPVFAGALSTMFLHERVTRRVLWSMTVALAGVVLTANSFPRGFGWWEGVALLSAIASGGAVTAMRAARRTEGVWSVYATMTAFGAVSTGVLAWREWRSPSVGQLAGLAVLSAFAFAGQFLMMRSLRWLSAMTIGVLAQLAVIVSMVLGYVVLDEPLTVRLIAAAFITLGGVVATVVFTSESRSRPPAAVTALPQTRESDKESRAA